MSKFLFLEVVAIALIFVSYFIFRVAVELARSGHLRISKDVLEEVPFLYPLAWLLDGFTAMVAWWDKPHSRSWIANGLLFRRFRLAVINGYVAFGDKTVALATIAPSFRRRLWEQWRRPRLLRRASLIESRIG